MFPQVPMTRQGQHPIFRSGCLPCQWRRPLPRTQTGATPVLTSRDCHRILQCCLSYGHYVGFFINFVSPWPPHTKYCPLPILWQSRAWVWLFENFWWTSRRKCLHNNYWNYWWCLPYYSMCFHFYNKGFVLLTILLAEMRLQWHAEVSLGVLMHVLCCCYQEFPLWNETSKSSQVTSLGVPSYVLSNSFLWSGEPYWALCVKQNLCSCNVILSHCQSEKLQFSETDMNIYSMILAHLQWTKPTYTIYVMQWNF